MSEQKTHMIEVTEEALQALHHIQSATQAPNVTLVVDKVVGDWLFSMAKELRWGGQHAEAVKIHSLPLMRSGAPVMVPPGAHTPAEEPSDE